MGTYLATSGWALKEGVEPGPVQHHLLGGDRGHLGGKLDLTSQMYECSRIRVADA